MSNPQAPGKQGRKDSKNKTPQHQQASGAPGQGEHRHQSPQHQPSQRSGEHGQRHPGQSHSSQHEDE
jgi:hypothetical protein